jgi:hypothetical protein
LAHTGLITQRRLGRLMVYAANPGLMSELVGYLASNYATAAENA